MPKALREALDVLSKNTVGYDKGMPKSHCGPSQRWPGGSCEHFMEPAGCTIVSGVIGREMWCRRFLPKE